MWDGDFGEDEKGEFCDAVGSGGWHGGAFDGWFGLLFGLGLIGWLDGCLLGCSWFVGLRSAKWMDAD